jgi:hypothetical protein
MAKKSDAMYGNLDDSDKENIYNKLSEEAEWRSMIMF